MDGTNRIDELEQKFIENPRRYFAPLANEYRKAGNPHQAIAICQAHLGQLPGHMSGQIVYGQALFEGGEYEQAQTVFENALAMDRENLVALRHLGDLALRKGEPAAARQWYAKFLEIDPKDAAVITLLNEIDDATDAQPPASTEEGSAEPAVIEPAESAAAAADAESFHSTEEDNLIAEELGYPMPSPGAFVTETMAELYLAQGFRDRALNVYRQLIVIRPDDERIRIRLAELEQTESLAAHSVEASPADPVAASTTDAVPAFTADPDAVSITDSLADSSLPPESLTELPLIEFDPPPIVARQDDEPLIESAEMSLESDRSAWIEEPVPPAPDVEPPVEEPPSGESFRIDSPPADSPPSEPDTIESPSREEPRAEPDSIESPPSEEEPAEPDSIESRSSEEEPAEPDSIESPSPEEPRAEPESVGAQLTVREFFAGLGRRRPSSRTGGSNGNGATEYSPVRDIFDGSPGTGSDQAAASALAGAFSAPVAAPQRETAPSPAISSSSGKESEEDVARFRAWLDGLTGQ